MLRPGWRNGEQHRHAINGLTLRITHTHNRLGSLWVSRVWKTKENDRIGDLQRDPITTL
jgi:hypothetical protein